MQKLETKILISKFNIIKNLRWVQSGKKVFKKNQRTESNTDILKILNRI